MRTASCFNNQTQLGLTCSSPSEKRNQGKLPQKLHAALQICTKICMQGTGTPTTFPSWQQRVFFCSEQIPFQKENDKQTWSEQQPKFHLLPAPIYFKVWGRVQSAGELWKFSCPETVLWERETSGWEATIFWKQQAQQAPRVPHSQQLFPKCRHIKPQYSILSPGNTSWPGCSQPLQWMLPLQSQPVPGHVGQPTSGGKTHAAQLGRRSTPGHR